MSEAVSDSIVVAAGPAAVWDVIADFEAYPEWQEEITEVEVLETGDDGWARKVRMVVDAGVLTAELVLAYTYTDDTMRWHLVEGHGVRRNDGTYTLSELDDGSTHVTYELEIAPSVPLPGVMRRKAARRIITGALRDMKQRAESLA